MTAAEAGDTPILQGLLREREDRELFPPVSGDLAEVLEEPPTVEFRPVRVGSWGWVRRNLNVKRLVAGGASAVVLLAGFLGWVQ